MQSLMQSASKISPATWIASACLSVLLTGPASSDVIMDWNAKADAIGVEKQLVNVPNARGQAMLHVAMFEAVNAIEQRYAPYKLSLESDRTASKEAAAASAAYEVLLSLYPDQKQGLDTALATSLSGTTNTEAKAKGIELGKKAAAGIIALRVNDGSNARESYRPHAKPGVYVPTALPIESTSGVLKPFVMTVGSQFRPGSPPSLDSETWTKDLNEIREIGGLGSTRRTDEQTGIARFWFLTGPRTYNPIVRQIALAKSMDLVDCARLYALSSLAAVDAFISIFDAKYTYNLWRPVTAIRNADLTANPATPREASWTPVGVTPMHPEYPCAHCIVAAAVSTVLKSAAGNEVDITLTSATAPGVTRKWTRLQDYSDEVSNARVYAGFHYRFSTEVGKDMGRKIGELVVATQLRGTVASAESKP
jgi:PAP2 superfamily